MTAPLRPAADAFSSPAVPVAPWSPRALVTAAVALVLFGALALVIDLPVAAWCKSGGMPKELLRFFNFCEVFAHSMGAAALLVTALVLDPGLAFPAIGWPAIRWPTFQPTIPRERMARMIGATACGGLVVDLIKLGVSRARPRAIDLATHASAFTTFGLVPGAAGRSDSHSFPSGHAAVAFGLCAALAWRYPRGRWLFLVFAVSAALQRVATSAHYPSDVCFGAALGFVGAALFLAGRSSGAGTSRAL